MFQFYLQFELSLLLPLASLKLKENVNHVTMCEWEVDYTNTLRIRLVVGHLLHNIFISYGE